MDFSSLLPQVRHRSPGPRSATARPRLEALEDRITPSTTGGDPSPSPPPPSLFQAVTSLYLDGALAATNVAVNVAIFQFQAQAHNPDVLPGATDPVAQGLETLDIELDEFRHLDTPAALQADITANLPYAGRNTCSSSAHKSGAGSWSAPAPNNRG